MYVLLFFPKVYNSEIVCFGRCQVQSINLLKFVGNSPDSMEVYILTHSDANP